MNKKLFLIGLIALSSSLYSNELPITDVRSSSVERASYENILRILNEKDDELTDKEMDNMNIVTFYRGDHEKDILSSEKNRYTGSNYKTLGEVLSNGKDAYTKEELSQLGILDVGPAQRLFFGNKNVVEDISYLSEDNYKTKIDQLEENGNAKYKIEGQYEKPYLTEETANITKKILRDIDPLNIPIEEYNEKIKGKSKEEVIVYLQGKLSEGNIGSYIENGKLYTKDDKGEKWPVLWDIEPIRYRTGSNFKEMVWEKIYVYVPNSEIDSAFGNMTYSKDGSIYLEDKLNYDSEIKIRAKEVFKYEGDYDEFPHLEYGNLSLDGVNDIYKLYAKDKNKVLNNEITQDDFDKKWENIRTEYFEDKYKLENGELTESEFANIWNPTIDSNELLKDTQDLKKVEDKYDETDHYTRGASFIGKTSLAEIDEEYNYQLGRINDDITKYPSWTYGKELKEKLIETYTAYRELIVKKEEFYNKYKAVLLNSNVVLANKAKKLNLNGQGRVNGTINMGQGYNTLVITEPGTGKYGSNIIFGPYSKLENIQVLEAGKAFATKDGEESISGDYSMIIDIDENAKNEAGEINQHLFKDSSKDLIVKSWSDFIDEFKIGVIVSRINRDEVLNMERPLYSNWIREYETTGGEIVKEDRESKLIFVSDSIAHELIERDKEKGIIDIKVKDEIDGLSSSENKVYQSIKNAGIIGELSDTLTSSNKTTIFGGNRENEALNELKTLVDEIRIKNIYSYLGKASKDSSDNFKYIPMERNKNIKQGSYVNGGSISKRFTKDNIKGNVYSGYGVYENDFKGLRLGGIIGGTSSSYKETNQKNFNEIFTDSKIEGMSAYVGSYLRKDFNEKLSVINGLGLQYGEYKTTRNLKNNYQDFDFTSKTNVNDFNLYSGLLYNIDLKNNMSLKLKGILSYDFVMQGKVQEDEDILGMEVEKQNFNFLDGELGLGLSKILYSDNAISEITGEVSYKYGLVGYKDETLNGKIKDSTSDFEIERQKLDKDFAKFAIRYDVKRDSGLTYGLGGEFSRSNEEKNINVKLNVGYTL